MKKNKIRGILVGCSLFAAGVLFLGFALERENSRASEARLESHVRERRAAMDNWRKLWGRQLDRFLEVSRHLQMLLHIEEGLTLEEESTSEFPLIFSMVESHSTLQSIVLARNDGSVSLRLEKFGGRPRMADPRLTSTIPESVLELLPGDLFPEAIQLKEDRGVVMNPWTPVFILWVRLPADTFRETDFMRLEFRVESLLQEAESNHLELLAAAGDWVAGSDLSHRWGAQLPFGLNFSEYAPEQWLLMESTPSGENRDWEDFLMWESFSLGGGATFSGGTPDFPQRLIPGATYRMLTRHLPAYFQAANQADGQRLFLILFAGCLAWGGCLSLPVCR